MPALLRASRTRRGPGLFLSIVMLLGLSVGLVSDNAQPSTVSGVSSQVRPNILLIITDDQRYDTMNAMPRTSERIFEQGLAFSNAFVTTSLCCPSRASIFSGMLARDHGVHNNQNPYTPTTLAHHLHGAGYYTGLVGKYLNSWDAGRPSRPRPEFDYWVEARGNAIFGTTERYSGYNTYMNRDYALDFIRKSESRQQPFFLTFATNAPHAPATPASGDENLYANLPEHRPPSHNEDDLSDKPEWVQSNDLLTGSEIAALDTFRRKQLQSLNAMDIAIDDILNLLQRQGRLDDTVVLFISDNGVFWGEHRFGIGKNEAYEEAIHVPFAIRYPGLITKPRIESRLVANIDIAPTLYELAGLRIPTGVAGRSLVPLMTGTPTWRDELLLEGWPTPGEERGRADPYRGVRTERHVFVDYETGRDELYDLETDPFQIQNEIENPAYDSIQADLESRLERLTAEPAVIDSAAPAITYDAWLGVSVTNGRSMGGSFRASRLANRTIEYTTPHPTGAITLITYRGPDQGMVRVTIDGVMQDTLDLYAPDAEPRSEKIYRNLGAGVHTVVITTLEEKNPASTGTEVRIDAIVAGSSIGGVTVDDHMTELRYGCWNGTIQADAYGGSYRSARCRDSNVRFEVSGTEFTWLTARGPAYGRANIYVDNVLKETVDLYQPTQQWQHRHVVSGLGPGNHTVRIQVLGARNPRSTANTVVFDGVALTGTGPQ